MHRVRGFHGRHRYSERRYHRSGQRFAVASMEVCTRILSRDNDATICWVPAHNGNEKADEYAKAAAEGRSDEVPDEHR